MEPKGDPRSTPAADPRFDPVTRQPHTGWLSPELLLAALLILCLSETVLSSARGHQPGIILGAVLFVLSGIALLAAAFPLRCISSSGFNLAACITCKADNKVLRYGGRTLLWILVVLVTFKLVIGIACRMAAPKMLFPDACEVDGCTRVSYQSAQRGEGLKPLQYSVDMTAAADIVKRWIEGEPMGYLESESVVPSPTPGSAALVQTLLHGRFLTRWMGFSDDLFVLLRCSNEALLVEAQSSLRVGRDDFGVNEQRVRRLWGHLKDELPTLPHAKCPPESQDAMHR
ncbi:unnamed protein product [Vitrella brassicaformis CCMP3155]|uniref:DUF1499 domain-containing protein n=2 Tax=Vitrella brassicaformis TaxID=1169539 RepID=A0A0G4EPT8_VITBC|nr:unnamed protein product [Vitrella brassicaformis CCMP3155]|eukprot:CEL99849.1 unnamed protein product [Vitrella brassicaformis CCMP3155]